MRSTIILLALALFPVLAACSAPAQTEGCRVTHTNEIKLNSEVPLTRDGEPLALNPGDSYQVWCARKINESNMGDIITEDQRTIRIDTMPADTELRVYPNERDTVYSGQPVASSGSVWKGIEKASSGWLPQGLSTWHYAGLAALGIVILIFGFRIGRKTAPVTPNGIIADGDGAGNAIADGDGTGNAIVDGDGAGNTNMPGWLQN